jgi:hypothetical protein
MKSILRTGSIALAAFFALGISANAQVSRQYLVHIPFDFKVGEKVLKAGDYRLGPLEGTTNERAVLLQNSSNNDAQVLGQTAIDSTGSNKQGRLTFAKISDQWLLRDVETVGFKLKLRVPVSDQGNVATAGKPVETKTVSLNR